MKLHLVHDQAGRILAAVPLPSDGAIVPRPCAGEGQHELVVQVPAEHGHKSLLDLCVGLKVDVKAKALVAIPG